MWWGNQQQRNAGLPPSMDPGSPSAFSLGRPGKRTKAGGRGWGVGGGFLKNDAKQIEGGLAGDKNGASCIPLPASHIQHFVSPAKRVTLTRASRGPRRAQTPRLRLRLRHQSCFLTEGLMRSNLQQSNFGVSPGMDSGSPSAFSPGRPGIRIKQLVVGGLWLVVDQLAATKSRLSVQHVPRVSLAT